MGGLAIEAKGLFKAFDGKAAVDGIDIAVPEGTIYGVLGPNGAGKTTTLRMLLGIIDPDEGRRTLLGHERPLDAARQVGYLNLRNFISTADPNLRAAFATFKAQGVTELIIDLRYNGGGLLSIAAYMIDLMGQGRAGQVALERGFLKTAHPLEALQPVEHGGPRFGSDGLRVLQLGQRRQHHPPLGLHPRHHVE